MNRFSIRDIENMTGIKAHTLRIWEQRYGILKPKRTTTNIRYYDAVDLKSVLRIALLNNYGYKISHIHEMTEEQINTAIDKIEGADFKLQASVNQMVEAMLAFDDVLFETLLDKHIAKHGIEKAIEQLIFNFLEKVGVMWMTDKVFIAQEHLVSNIIYRKLMLAIEKQPITKNAVAPKVLLFLPEGELHEMGLLYVFYLMRKFDKHPIYLGANTPIGEVLAVTNVHQPDYLFIHLTSASSDFDCNKYLNTVLKTIPNIPIMVSGSILSTAKPTVDPRIMSIYTLKEAREKIITL
ncbi:MAG: MerR family transcriptional regulator [Bacteroidetes bacterium]|nr:MerR family transcriptional regulator [Bacteroidota bacterium]